MDFYSREYLKDFLVALYGEQARPWDMNEEVANQVVLMIIETDKCSRAIDYIPRPLPYGSNPVSWLGKEAAKGLFRHLSDNKEQYAICYATGSANWRSKIQLASMGL